MANPRTNSPAEWLERALERIKRAVEGLLEPEPKPVPIPVRVRRPRPGHHEG